MQNWGYYTPDGVSDYLPELCLEKRLIESRLRQLFQTSAFEEIETSGLEFFDAYTKIGDFASQEELFKVADSRGRLLALRYDGTIPAARLAATTLKHDPLPLRLSYIGRMYRFGEHGGGRMQEFTQAGIELLGVSGTAADAEMIAMAIAALQTVGLSDIQIAVGQSAYFKQLSKNWQVEASLVDRLIDYIDSRNEVAVQECLHTMDIKDQDKEIVEAILKSNGDFALLDDLKEKTKDIEARAVLSELEALRDLLDAWGLLQYISLDLAQLSSMSYYTGLIFRGYTYGIGFPICSGGRYDDLVLAFGKDMAATGFSLGVDLCLQALRRQAKISLDKKKPAVCLVDVGQAQFAWSLAMQYREETGIPLSLAWPDDKSMDERIAAVDEEQACYIINEEGLLEAVRRDKDA